MNQALLAWSLPFFVFVSEITLCWSKQFCEKYSEYSVPKLYCTSDDKHLVVELGRHPHEEVHVEVVVMRGEGLGRRPARDHVHHRGLNLQEAQLVEEAAHVGDNLGAHLELLAHVLVDDEVQVALAKPRFLILE